MRLGGMGIATVNLRAYDGASWHNLRLQSSTHHHLRVTVTDSDYMANVKHWNSDGLSTIICGLVALAGLYGFNGATWDRIRSDPNKHLNVNIGGLAALNHGQVNVGSTATSIRAANLARKAITIKNIGASAVYLGGSGVTTGNGFKLEAGEALNDIRTTAEIRGICAGGETTKVCFWEE